MWTLPQKYSVYNHLILKLWVNEGIRLWGNNFMKFTTKVYTLKLFLAATGSCHNFASDTHWASVCGLHEGYLVVRTTWTSQLPQSGLRPKATQSWKVDIDLSVVLEVFATLGMVFIVMCGNAPSKWKKKTPSVILSASTVMVKNV